MLARVLLLAALALGTQVDCSSALAGTRTLLIHNDIAQCADLRLFWNNELVQGGLQHGDCIEVPKEGADQHRVYCADTDLWSGTATGPQGGSCSH